MSAKKVAIAGYGVEGRVNYTYWRELGHEVTIVDERELSPYDLPYGAAARLGKNVFKKLSDFDLVIRTASLRPDKIKTKGKVWSATNEFFGKCPAPIIGVTGTKGKGTTSSLIASILRAAGKTVHLLGNIGTPALEILPTIKADDVVVFELSSFQLWDIEKSPHIAVVLMIEPDHLDVHKNMNEYIQAKGRITAYQHTDDVVVYNQQNHFASEIALRSKANKLPYVATVDDAFYVGEQTVAPLEALQLPGHHNIDNANAAILAAWQIMQDAAAVEAGLRAFTGLDHRLKFVAEVGGVRFYDDSIATTPGSALAAIDAFDAPKVIILGGSEKGSHYEEVVKRCKATDTKVVAIGTTGKLIAKLCKKAGVEVQELGKASMDEIVRAGHALASGNGVVLLSPASASFDMFESYVDRGDQFVAAVGRLSK